MNLIEIAGHLGDEVETRVVPKGQKVSTFRVATNVRRGGKDTTVWYRVTIWGDRFDKMLPYLKKGSAVIVVGELAPPTIYNDREGNPRVSLEITAEIIRFSPFGRSDRTQNQEGNSDESAGTSYGANSGAALSMEMDLHEEEIPF